MNHLESAAFRSRSHDSRLRDFGGMLGYAGIPDARSRRRRADGCANRRAVSNEYADAVRYAVSNEHANRDRHAHANRDEYAHADGRADLYALANADLYAIAHEYADRHIHANRYARPNVDAVADANRDVDADSAYRHAREYAHAAPSDRHANADGDADSAGAGRSRLALPNRRLDWLQASDTGWNGLRRVRRRVAVRARRGEWRRAVGIRRRSGNRRGLGVRRRAYHRGGFGWARPRGRARYRSPQMDNRAHKPDLGQGVRERKRRVRRQQRQRDPRFQHGRRLPALDL